MENNILSQLINSLKVNCSKNEEIKKPILTAISDVENQLNNDIINLVFLGYFNEGKKTMINSIIACVTNNYENVRLFSSQLENTYFPTVIERSPDQNYYITIIQSNNEEEIKYSDPKEIIKKLDEFDDNSTDSLHDLKDLTQEKLASYLL